MRLTTLLIPLLLVGTAKATDADRVQVALALASANHVGHPSAPTQTTGASLDWNTTPVGTCVGGQCQPPTPLAPPTVVRAPVYGVWQPPAPAWYQPVPQPVPMMTPSYSPTPGNCPGVRCPMPQTWGPVPGSYQPIYR